MINKFVTDKVLNKTLVESIGKKEITSLTYIGNRHGSISMKINGKDRDQALITGEFLRYLVLNEEVTFVCMAIKSFCITPEDTLKMTDEETRLIQESPSSITSSQYAKETLQINVESKLGVSLRTYELIKNQSGLIINLKEVESMRLDGTIKELGIASSLSDFFSGLKTDILASNPHIKDNFKVRAKKLMDSMSE